MKTSMMNLTDRLGSRTKTSPVVLIGILAIFSTACAGEPSTSSTPDASNMQAVQSTDASADAMDDAVGIPTAAECEAATNETDCYSLGCTYFVEVTARHMVEGACSEIELQQRCLVTVSGESERPGDASSYYYRGENEDYEVFGVRDLGRVQGWTHYLDYPGPGQAPCTDGRT